MYSQIPTDSTQSDSKLHIYPQIGHNIIKDTHRCTNSYPSLGISNANLASLWFGLVLNLMWSCYLLFVVFVGLVELGNFVLKLISAYYVNICGDGGGDGGGDGDAV